MVSYLPGEEWVSESVVTRSAGYGKEEVETKWRSCSSKRSDLANSHGKTATLELKHEPATGRAARAGEAVECRRARRPVASAGLRPPAQVPYIHIFIHSSATHSRLRTNKLFIFRTFLTAVAARCVYTISNYTPRCKDTPLAVQRVFILRPIVSLSLFLKTQFQSTAFGQSCLRVTKRYICPCVVGVLWKRRQWPTCGLLNYEV